VVRSLYDLRPDTSGAIMLYLADPAGSDDVLRRTRNLLIDQGFSLLDHQPQPFWMKFEPIVAEEWTGQKLDLTTWSDEVASAKSMIDGLTALSTFIALLLGSLIAAGIGSAMWISVHERTAELGTMRALGMSRRAVLGLMLCETALLGVVATLVGATLAVLVTFATRLIDVQVSNEAARALLMSDTLRLEPSTGHLVSALIVFTSATVLAGLWPAFQAGRVNPAVTMQR
jgi:putative ABC transport system permease protein